MLSLGGVAVRFGCGLYAVVIAGDIRWMATGGGECVVPVNGVDE